MLPHLILLAVSIGLPPFFEATPLELFLLCRHRALLGCFLGEPWRRAGSVVSHWWKQHWCSWWTEGSFSRLLSSLGTLMGKEYYLRAFFIHHEAQGPLTFSRGAHVCLSSTEHRWPLPPSWNVFFLWCYSILILLTTHCCFFFFSVFPAGILLFLFLASKLWSARRALFSELFPISFTS